MEPKVGEFAVWQDYYKAAAAQIIKVTPKKVFVKGQLWNGRVGRDEQFFTGKLLACFPQEEVANAYKDALNKITDEFVSERRDWVEKQSARRKERLAQIKAEFGIPA